MASQTRARIEDAIAAGDFARAHQFIPEYVQQALAGLAAIPSHSERQRAAAALFDSFEHLLTLARISRSHISAHLTSVNRELFWTRSQQQGTTYPSWRIEA
jgi:hypothetical protein